MATFDPKSKTIMSTEKKNSVFMDSDNIIFMDGNNMIFQEGVGNTWVAEAKNSASWDAQTKS